MPENDRTTSAMRIPVWVLCDTALIEPCGLLNSLVTVPMEGRPEQLLPIYQTENLAAEAAAKCRERVLAFWELQRYDQAAAVLDVAINSRTPVLLGFVNEGDAPGHYRLVDAAELRAGITFHAAMEEDELYRTYGVPLPPLPPSAVGLPRRAT